MNARHIWRRVRGRPGPEDLILGLARSPHTHPEYRITPRMQANHTFVLGTTGTGKSRGVLSSMFIQRHRKTGGVLLIDPHGSAARDILAHEVEDGAFEKKGAFNRLRYLRFAMDEVPSLNVLQASHVQPEDIALGIKDAMTRSFPELEGAATFETLCGPSVLCLVQNGLPLPLMGQLLTSPVLRKACLANVDNPTTHQAFEMLPERPQSLQQMAGSLLRRIHQLGFHSISRHALMQPDTVLPLRELMDNGTSVLVDLGSVHNGGVKRFLAAAILTSLERAAFTRDDLLERNRRPYMVMVDEFPAVAPRDGRTVETITAELRKFKVSWLMVGQSLAQFSHEGLTASIENSGLTVLLGLGHGSAKAMAPTILKSDAELVKYPAERVGGRDTMISAGEQLQALTEDLRHLPPRHAVASMRGESPVLVRLLDVPDPKPDPRALADVLAEYRRLYHRTYDEAQKASLEAIRATGLPVIVEGLFSPQSGESSEREDNNNDYFEFGESLHPTDPEG